MYIEITTKITFDPVKDYESMTIFEKDNPEWKKRIATTGYTFIKTDSYYTEYLIKTKES